MNPFSAFLQPPTQRSPLEGAGEFVNQLSQLGLQRKQLAQNATAQADSSARDWKRIGLQEAVQNRNMSDADKKEREGLLAEYLDAKNSGNPQRLADAAQMLKRFGIDVSQETPKGEAEAPILSQEDFEKQLIEGSSTPPLPGMLPQIVGPGKPQDFTGTPPQSQQQFEADPIANPQAVPESPEGGADDGPDIAGHLKSVAKLRPLPGTMGPLEMTSGEGATVGGAKAPQVEQAQQAPQAAASVAEPPPLPGGALPQVTRLTQNGKTLYESSSPSGRWAPMVQSVFEPLTKNANPDLAAAGGRAMELAGKLIAVDGISPKDAIEFAAKRYQDEASGIIGLERTKLGSNANRHGGGGGAPGLLGKTQDIAESIQVYDDNARQAAMKLEEEDRQYEGIEAKANSGDPTMIRDAINELFKIRAGTAVSAAEDARISNINGLLAKIQDKFGQWTGGPPSPELIRYIQQVAQMKRQINADKRQRIYDHQADLYEAQNKGKTKDPTIITERSKKIREGGAAGGGLNHLWE